MVITNEIYTYFSRTKLPEPSLNEYYAKLMNKLNICVYCII